MSDLYNNLEGIWKRHLDGDNSNTGKDILALLNSQGIRIRQDDGEFKQSTVSKPTSVQSAFVIGLRYDKRDGTQTEDPFSIEQGRPIEPHYRGSLERKWPEYRGTHKQQVLYTLVIDVQATMTSVNTITVLKHE